MKQNVRADKRYDSIVDAEMSIRNFIEDFYNTERLHSHLDYVSPIEFELKSEVRRLVA